MWTLQTRNNGTYNWLTLCAPLTSSSSQRACTFTQVQQSQKLSLFLATLLAPRIFRNLSERCAPLANLLPPPPHRPSSRLVRPGSKLRYSLRDHPPTLSNCKNASGIHFLYASLDMLLGDLDDWLRAYRVFRRAFLTNSSAISFPTVSTELVQEPTKA